MWCQLCPQFHHPIHRHIPNYPIYRFVKCAQFVGSLTRLSLTTASSFTGVGGSWRSFGTFHIEGREVQLGPLPHPLLVSALLWSSSLKRRAATWLQDELFPAMQEQCPYSTAPDLLMATAALYVSLSFCEGKTAARTTEYSVEVLLFIATV